jgi:hypothetical protein
MRKQEGQKEQKGQKVLFLPFLLSYGSLTLKRNFENGLPRREPMKCGL